MPFVADLNDWQIKTMEELGRGDRATALKFDARIKGLANTMKNYRGKLVGMKRLGLVATKRGRGGRAAEVHRRGPAAEGDLRHGRSSRRAGSTPR